MAVLGDETSIISRIFFFYVFIEWEKSVVHLECWVEVSRLSKRVFNQCLHLPQNSMHDNRWEGEIEQEKEKEDKTKREEKAKKKKNKEEVQDAKPPTTEKVRFFIWIKNCINLHLICFVLNHWYSKMFACSAAHVRKVFLNKMCPS